MKKIIIICSLLGFGTVISYPQMNTEIPKSLSNSSSSQLKISEILENYSVLMSSPDSTLDKAKRKAKRKAERWIIKVSHRI
jgi:hypothetical protein